MDKWKRYLVTAAVTLIVCLTGLQVLADDTALEIVRALKSGISHSENPDVIRIEYISYTIGEDDVNVAAVPDYVLQPGDQVNIMARINVKSALPERKIFNKYSGLNVAVSVYYGDMWAPFEIIKLYDGVVENFNINNEEIQVYGQHVIPEFTKEKFEAYKPDPENLELGEELSNTVFSKIRYEINAIRYDPIFNITKKFSASSSQSFPINSGRRIQDIEMREKEEDFEFIVRVGANGIDHYARGTEFALKSGIIYLEDDGIFGTVWKQEALTTGEGGKVSLFKIDPNENSKEIIYIKPKSDFPVLSNIRGDSTVFIFHSDMNIPYGESDSFIKEFRLREEW